MRERKQMTRLGKFENASCIWMKVVQGNPLTTDEKWGGEGRWRKENRGN
jgi:hypothetical protein